MKKSILFGVLAFFAISAMSVQNVEAQNPKKKANKTEVPSKQKVTGEKHSTDANESDSQVTEKKDKKKSGDCCAPKGKCDKKGTPKAAVKEKNPKTDKSKEDVKRPSKQEADK